MKNNNSLSNLEIGCITFFLTRCSYIGVTISLLAFLLKQDAWIGFLMGIIIGLIPLIMYLYIIKYKPDFNIFEIIESLFGKVIGKILIGIILVLIGYYTLMVFANVCYFIGSQFLHQTPIIVIAIAFMIPIVYGLFKGIKIIGRVSILLFIIAMILIFLLLIGLIPSADLNNIKPIFEHGFLNNIKDCLVFIFYNVLPLFVISVIPKDKNNSKSFNKYVIIFYLLSSFISLSTLIIIFAVLGYFSGLIVKV